MTEMDKFAASIGRAAEIAKSGEKYPAKPVTPEYAKQIARDYIAIYTAERGSLTYVITQSDVLAWERALAAIERLQSSCAAMREALYAAETVMMIVEPRSHKAEYLEPLKKVCAALRVADGE